MNRVRASWSRLTRRHFAIAIGAGAALGAVQGLGHTITQAGPWWLHLAASTVPPVALALFLLLALAIAGDVELPRLPRWLPLAAAAIVAAIGAACVDWATDYVLARILGEPWQFRPIGVAHYAWSWGPYLLTLAAFAAFGARQAIDARRRSEHLRHVQLDRVRMAREAYESRLVALQARVEPRFLFETLSATEALYEEDEAAGASLLDDLIVYLRAALPDADDVSSTLADELVLVRAWLDIVRLRTRERLWFALPENLAATSARMPPMLLLPLVQHAAETAGNDSAVFISVDREQDRLRITVTAGATAFAGREPSPAIANVRQRLADIYGPDGSLQLAASMHDRSRATVDIPHEPVHRAAR